MDALSLMCWIGSGGLLANALAVSKRMLDATTPYAAADGYKTVSDPNQLELAMVFV